jgi:hypothetical protein
LESEVARTIVLAFNFGKPKFRSPWQTSVKPGLSDRFFRRGATLHKINAEVDSPKRSVFIGS